MPRCSLLPAVVHQASHARTFARCGTTFATHVVDNPDAASQLQLLRAYAPSLPAHVPARLVRAFDELRGLVRDWLDEREPREVQNVR